MGNDLPHIQLTNHELMMAALVGVMRHVGSLKRGLQPKHGCKEDECWQVHLEGACGEAALAKYLNLFWDGTVNTFKRGGDVGEFQVRTRSRHDYELLIRHDDPPEKIYWLVTGLAPSYVIRGWMRGSEVMMHEDWYKSHGGRPPAWFAPQRFLHPPTEDP